MFFLIFSFTKTSLARSLARGAPRHLLAFQLVQSHANNVTQRSSARVRTYLCTLGHAPSRGAGASLAFQLVPNHVYNVTYREALLDRVFVRVRLVALPRKALLGASLTFQLLLSRMKLAVEFALPLLEQIVATRL